MITQHTKIWGEFDQKIGPSLNCSLAYHSVQLKKDNQGVTGKAGYINYPDKKGKGLRTELLCSSAGLERQTRGPEAGPGSRPPSAVL